MREPSLSNPLSSIGRHPIGIHVGCIMLWHYTKKKRFLHAHKHTKFYIWRRKEMGGHQIFLPWSPNPFSAIASQPFPRIFFNISTILLSLLLNCLASEGRITRLHIYECMIFDKPSPLACWSLYMHGFLYPYERMSITFFS